MTPEEKKQLEQIARQALDRLKSEPLTQETSELLDVIGNLDDVQSFCAGGVSHMVDESGFRGELTKDTVISLTTDQLYRFALSAFSLGMDITIMMHRYGAKFPVPRSN